MRTIKELLQLILDNQQLFQCGLCGWRYNLSAKDLITGEEDELLHKYFQANKPEFKFINNFYNPDKIEKNSLFFWKQNKIKPRIKWLKEHINKN